MPTRRTAVLSRRANEHRSAALRFRRNADALLQEGERESAGTLLYEAAKRCINAVANQGGSNPVRTVAKFQFLQSIVAQSHPNFDLIKGWHAAGDLHSHADQSHLDNERFEDAWENTQAFIAEMLAIYDQGQP